jgi:hypothetical protein
VTVLITVAGPRQRHDLAVADDVLIRDLIPELVQRCVEPLMQTQGAAWAVGRIGEAPLPPTQTLEQAAVLDGTILYLHDMSSPQVPPGTLPKKSR